MAASEGSLSPVLQALVDDLPHEIAGERLRRLQGAEDGVAGRDRQRPSFDGRRDRHHAPAAAAVDVITQGHYQTVPVDHLTPTGLPR